MVGSSVDVEVIAERVAETTTRIGELRERLRRLDLGEPSTTDDVRRARAQAVLQAEHCVSARNRLVESHRSAADRHEQIAAMLASRGLTDRAERQWAAARSDVEAAGVAVAQSQAEQQVLDRAREVAERPVEVTTSAPDRGIVAHRLEEENGRLRGALSGVFAWSGTGVPRQEERRQQLSRAVVARSRSPRWKGWAHSVCTVACSHITSVRGAAIAVRVGSSSPELIAADDVWAARMEELQHLVGDGPSITASRQAISVAADEVDAERWPGYAGVVAGSGLHGVWAFPLMVHGICFGSLTLYHLRHPSSLARSWEDGEMLADIAAAAVLADLGDGEDGSSRDLDRYLVHIAAGIIATQTETSVDDALAQLRAHAFGSGQSLGEVADLVVRGELRLS